MNEDTFGGTITRVEALYTLVKMFYADEYDATTGNEKVNCTVAKNGGNIAKECGFITVDKKSGEVTYKDLWKTYELSYALQTDNGLPTDLYRALVVAEKHGLITGTNSRWDEAVVKREVIDMLVVAFEDLGTVNNVDRGSDTSVLNLTDQVSDEVLDMSEEELKDFFEEIGIDPDKLSDTTSGSNSNTGGNNTGDTNGGGGSAPVVTPDTNQGSNIAEEDFITPEIPSGGNQGGSTGNSSGSIDFEAAIKENMENAGDGGPLTGNVSLNP